MCPDKYRKVRLKQKHNVPSVSLTSRTPWPRNRLLKDSPRRALTLRRAVTRPNRATRPSRAILRKAVIPLRVVTRLSTAILLSKAILLSMATPLNKATLPLATATLLHRLISIRFTSLMHV